MFENPKMNSSELSRVLKIYPGQFPMKEKLLEYKDWIGNSHMQDMRS